MALSYSGLVNYGKATLPSVESWGTNMNIMKDPPKAIHTRRIDKVGETMAVTTMVDESADRFCDSINYYARGQNPMVSVSYGQGQASSTQAYLPYRVARDGAFRPPIWRQEDLLPLSRMPRIWTTVSTQPYQPIFTMRLRDCGTSENTREVKNNLLNVSCEANRTVAAYSAINAPDVKPSMIRDPLVPGEIIAARSCGLSTSDSLKNQINGPVLLPTRDVTFGFTNPCSVRETPIVLQNVNLARNHPIAEAVTNYAAPSMSGFNPMSEAEFLRLPQRTCRGGFDNTAQIPSIEMFHPTKQLNRVR